VRTLRALRFILLMLCVCAGVYGFALAAETGAVLSNDDTDIDDTINVIIDNMTLRERVSQLFILALPGHTAPSEALESLVSASGAGGFILFKDNIKSTEQVKALTGALNIYADIPPFICIDEEGGVVSRLRGLAGFTPTSPARDIGGTGDTQNAYAAGETIGAAMARLGINVDFAPVADVLTNPNNKVIGSRAFGNDPETVGGMASAFQAGLRTHGVMAAPKHFPGHGNTADDSHIGLSVIASNATHLAAIEYPPFIRLIDEGAEFIMIGHITAPELCELPATLSEYFVTNVLRNELGFGGIIITDAMNMGAITRNYGVAEAAVMALQAGVDMVLMPDDFGAAVEGVLDAVANSGLAEERIVESLARVLRVKIKAGLM